VFVCTLVSSLVSNLKVLDVDTDEQLHRLAEGFERCEESNQEELLSSLTGSVERCIKQKLESVVQQEISTAVLPGNFIIHLLTTFNITNV